jgi:hypothetical protein
MAQLSTTMSVQRFKKTHFAFTPHNHRKEWETRNVPHDHKATAFHFLTSNRFWPSGTPAVSAGAADMAIVD